MKRNLKIVLLTLLAALLAGCAEKKVDELYKLPQQSVEYQQLQNKVDEIIADGAEYAAPTGGNNRQLVQFVDINGDGADEVFAFFSQTNDAKPLKIFVFTQKGESYENLAMIEGEGTSIESITYNDLDGDGIMEIIVGWKISAELQTLSVYSMIDFKPVSMVTENFSQYLCQDLAGNGRDDLIILNYNSSEGKGEVRMLTFPAAAEPEIYTSAISKGITAVGTLDSSYLRNDYPAVFLQSTYEHNEVIFDIFAFVDGQLRNVTAGENGISQKTLTTYPALISSAVRPVDINHDGTLELPNPSILRGTEELASPFYIIRWYSYDENGQEELVETTYHNYADGWYIAIPDEWVDRLSLRRIDVVTGERGIAFSVKQPGASTAMDFMTIYFLTGDNKADRAEVDGRKSLYVGATAIYAVEITGEIPDGLSESDIESRFGLITAAWD